MCSRFKDHSDGNLIHFQSLYDNKYKSIKVKDVSFDSDSRVYSYYDKLQLSLLDIDNKIMYFNADKEIDISDRLITTKMDDIIGNNDKIVSMYWQHKDRQVIFVKRKLNM